MMMLTALTTSMVMSQAAMKPQTSTRLRATVARTRTEPRMSARRTRVVRKTQARARPRFLKSSLVMTSSVSQFAYS